jgi:type IV secretion system protein TrbL
VDDLGVIDRFTNVFSAYIDSGFGLLGGEVAFLTATLVAIDIILAGLFWALGGSDDVMQKLVRKTLYIGAFAFIITNFNQLSGILFHSFARLGLIASDSLLTEDELLRPGRLAAVGVESARPILEEIGDLTGFPDVFVNLDTIAVLSIAWLVVIVSFFVLAVQLFVTLIEFKLTTLAGFILVPFALWNKTAFLAERVLGNVVSSGIKILVLAVIIGIGTNLFAEFVARPGGELTIDNALAIMLASLALFGLGLFGPSIATGLVAGGPQLGAGAAAGTALAAGGLTVGAAAATVAATGVAAAVGAGGLRAATGGAGAFMRGVKTSGTTGAGSILPGLTNVAREGGTALANRIRATATRLGLGTASSPTTDVSATSDGPGWAQKLRASRAPHGALAAAHVLRSTDRPSTGANPNLRQDD